MIFNFREFPSNANHVYCFMQYVYNFLHPHPTLRNNTGGTLPTPFVGQPIAESLQGLFQLFLKSASRFNRLA